MGQRGKKDVILYSVIISTIKLKVPNPQTLVLIHACMSVNTRCTFSLQKERGKDLDK